MHQYFLWRIHIQWVNNVIPYLDIYKKMPLKLAVVISTVSGINKGRSPSNGKLSDFSFYIDSQKSAHRKFKK
jgi:hypothetical protein